MTVWPSAKAKRVLAALERIGWTIKRHTGFHRAATRLDVENWERHMGQHREKKWLWLTTRGR